MVDYWFNMRASSTSKAPFNLCPFSLKFALMEPQLIYRSVLSESGVQTQVIPGRDAPQAHPLPQLTEFSRSTGHSHDSVMDLALMTRIATLGSKARVLERLEGARTDEGWANAELVNQLCEVVYWDRVRDHIAWLPQTLRPS